MASFLSTLWPCLCMQGFNYRIVYFRVWLQTSQRIHLLVSLFVLLLRCNRDWFQTYCVVFTGLIFNSQFSCLGFFRIWIIVMCHHSHCQANVLFTPLIMKHFKVNLTFMLVFPLSLSSKFLCH